MDFLGIPRARHAACAYHPTAGYYTLQETLRYPRSGMRWHVLRSTGLHINQSVPTLREKRSPQISISLGAGALPTNPKPSRTPGLKTCSTVRALSIPAIARSSANMPAILGVTGLPNAYRLSSASRQQVSRELGTEFQGDDLRVPMLDPKPRALPHCRCFGQ
jgi:hypothetical protein